MIRFFWILGIFSFSFIFAADATIDLVRNFQKTPVISVVYLDGKYSIQAQRIYKILLGDLNVSGHFEVQEGAEGRLMPDYSEYSNQGVDLFVSIGVQKNNTIYKANVRLYDINAKNLVFERSYLLDDDSLYPFVAHRITVDVNDYIQAPSISWMNRYVVFSSFVSSGRTNLIVSDYTLTYRKVIVQDGLNLFPKWANPEQTEIYFTKIINSTPTILRYNIYTGESTKVLSSEGMAIVSDVSKDAKRLLLTLAPHGEPDVYLYNIDNKEKIQITTYKGIDVSASFVNNGEAIIFVSDRLGYPNIFYKDLRKNSPVEQVVFHGRNNSSVSSFSNYVVYSSRETSNQFDYNTFNLYLISTRSDYIRRLTVNGVNQLPSFSSNGDSVMFLKHLPSQSALGIIRLDYNKTFLFPLSNVQIQSFDW